MLAKWRLPVRQAPAEGALSDLVRARTKGLVCLTLEHVLTSTAKSHPMAEQVQTQAKSALKLMKQRAAPSAKLAP
jgi:hypothetical protein